jgi:purine-nucleoside phosphorylase
MNDPHVDSWALARRAAAALVEGLGAEPEVVVVLGSGWQQAADAIGEVGAELDLATLPGFAVPGAPDHGRAVRLVAVPRSGGLPPVSAAVYLGRPHLFEGHEPATVVHPVRAAVLAGARTVVLTNAAGTLHDRHRVGLPVLIADQLNLTGRSPLTGPEPPSPHAGRFVDMTDLYSPRLRELARRVAPELAEDVYAGLPGPQFETPAEIRAYRTLGAGVLGFSTVLEAIAARHLGAEVLGLSLVTNLCAGMQPVVDGDEVLAVGRDASPRLGSLAAAVLGELPPG